MVMHTLCKICVHVRGPPLGSLTERGCRREEVQCLIEWMRCWEMKLHEAPELMRILVLVSFDGCMEVKER